MSELVDLFNEKLDNIKTTINFLYDKSKEQYSKQKNKSFASFIELSHVFPKREDYTDDFQDVTKIESENSLLIDPDGYTLAYNVDDIKFKDSYYSKVVYPLTMVNGVVIPGSNFSDIFQNNIGFWGYQADDPTYSFFSVDLKEKSTINKVYLETNNSIEVTLYIREDFEKDWIEIGTRSGTNHSWNFTPINCVAMKFIAYTNLFSVSRLRTGYSKYNKSGVLVSQWYEMENLYKIKLDTDKDVPENTNIDFFIRVSGQPDLYPIEEEIEITGGVEWHTEAPSSGKLPSGYIDGSLTVKTGYEQWDVIDTYDWKWLPLKLPDPGPFTGELTFTDEYKVLQGSLRKVMLGDKEFILDEDYAVEYDLDARKITVKRLDNSSIPTAEIPNLQCSVLIRQKSIVKQIRTYVYLESDQTIVMQEFPTIDPNKSFRVRHVVITDEIIRDITQEINDTNKLLLIQDIGGVDSYVINGLTGLNLIEVEFIDTGNKYIPSPDLPILSNVDHYARKYNLEYVLDSPEEGQYTVQPSGTQYEIVAQPSGGLWISYAEMIPPSGLSHIQLEARFTSTDGRNTSTLRKYQLENYNI